jgi:hypothetical protein
LLHVAACSTRLALPPQRRRDTQPSSAAGDHGLAEAVAARGAKVSVAELQPPARQRVNSHRRHAARDAKEARAHALRCDAFAAVVEQEPRGAIGAKTAGEQAHGAATASGWLASWTVVYGAATGAQHADMILKINK